MGSFVDLWLMLVLASAVLGGITFVVLLFAKTPRKPPLSGEATLAWVAALLAGGVMLASFSAEGSPNIVGVQSRMTLFVAGLGQFVAVMLIGFMSAGLTGLLPQAKRPNLIRTTLFLSTIMLTFSAIGQLVPK